MREKHKIIFGLILFLAAFLRLVNLGVGDLATDEAKTALGVDFPHSFVLPNLVVFSQNLLGINEFAARFPFALFGILGVLLFYFLGREIRGKAFGLLCCFVAAILPFNIALSRSVYLDVPLVVMWILILIFWLRFSQSRRYFDLFILFCCLLISPWFKIQAVYFFCILFFSLLFSTRGRFWRDERFWVLCLAPLPFLFYFLGQPQQIFDLIKYSHNSVRFSDVGILISFWMWLKSGGAWFVFALIGVWLSWRRNAKIETNERDVEIRRLMSIFFVVILLVLSSTQNSFYYYVMIDIPIVYFSVYFLMSLSRGWLRIPLIVVGCISSVWLIFSQTGLSKDFCVAHNGGCFWQTNKIQINTLIIELKPKKVFLSDSIGFEGKWYLGVSVYKISHLPIFLAQNKNALILFRPGEYDVITKKYGLLRVIKKFDYVWLAEPIQLVNPNKES